MSCVTTSCGAFGARSPAWAECACSTGAGTAAFSSNGSRGSRRPSSGRAAYDEIVDFERSLVHEGIILVKFWLQVSQDEQQRRFDDRGRDPLRRWKLNDEDWRNREKWPYYVEAIEDMFAKTDHEFAPWNLVSGEQKKWARVVVLETLNQRVAEGLARWKT